MVMSFMAVALPVEPVRAAATSIEIVAPTSGNVTTTGSGGTVWVYFRLHGDSGLGSYNVTATIGTVSGIISSCVADNTTIYAVSVTAPTVTTATYFNVTVNDGAGHTDTETNAVYVDTVVPIANLSVATTCWSTAAASGTYTVSYTGSKAGSISMIYDLQYNNGGGWAAVPAFPKTQAPNTYVLSIAPTDLGITTTCNLQFMLTVQDVATGMTSTAVYSTSIFVLQPTNITPAITYPNTTGLSFNGGSTMAITGTMTATGPTASYMLSLHTDGNPYGTAYENITASWQNVTISGTYAISKSWTVSQVSSANCVIALWVKDCSGNIRMAQSPSFTIVPTVGAGITVNWPTSGATMYTCSTTDNVTFTITGGSASTSTCLFYYATENSTDEGRWTNFTSGTFTPGRNSVAFSHPGIAAGTYYIRIKAVTNGVTSYGYSYSFNMKALTTSPTITLSAPNGGESLTGGTTTTITYACTQSADTSAPITYRISLLDGGTENMTVATFTLKNATGATSSFSWAVPNYTGANYKIRISATDPCGNSAYDDSNANFSITAGCATTTYGIPLYGGWNLISLPLIPVSTDINAVLSPVINNVDYVYYYNKGTWQVFVPGVTQGFSSIEVGKGYWVHIKGTAGTPSDPLTITGRKCFCGATVPTTTLVYTYNGWNLMGVKSVADQTISGYFKTCGGSPIFLPIYYWDPVTQTMGSTSDCNYTLTAGKGYWFWLNAPLGVNAPCE